MKYETLSQKFEYVSSMNISSKKFTKIAFIASEVPEAREAQKRLSDLYPNINDEPQKADVIVALGGDGLMLQTLHNYMTSGVPIYGMNRGSVGFLMNEFHEECLIERLTAAKISRLHPLVMTAYDAQGKESEGLAINEVSLFRQTHQAAKLNISVDGTDRMEELICDGIMVATPAGSTAYNLSAHGPILPLDAKLLALTPISAFRPRRWRGALLPDRAEISILVREPDKRPVSAVADNVETRNVVRVDIRQSKDIELHMMFDPGHSLDERVITEQFRL
ncbi:MAG: NAD kinase [Hyphomicrobium sp.]